jgi:hypothetical protein
MGLKTLKRLVISVNSKVNYIDHSVYPAAPKVSVSSIAIAAGLYPAVRPSVRWVTGLSVSVVWRRIDTVTNVIGRST